MKTEFVDVHGVKIAVRMGKSVPLVYIHGSGCDGSLWDSQLERIGGYAIDLPGHGLSDEAQIESVYDYAFYVAKVTENLVGKAIFLGHSLGGAIAQSLYLDFRKAVKGLILVGTGARLRVLPAILSGLKNKSEETVNMFVEMSFGRIEGFENMIEETKRQFIERIEVLLRDLTICDKFDLLDNYKKGEISVDVPTLIIVGENDKLTPIKYAQFFKSVIPQAQLVVIKDAGHMVMLEKPIEFNKAVLDFISKYD